MFVTGIAIGGFIAVTWLKNPGDIVVAESTQ